VKLNGQIQRNPNYPVNPDRAKIEIDGKQAIRPELKTYLLYKPRGVVTTRSDEKGRPTVFSILSELDFHLIAVGRLDLATTGLLLLTNDTQVADWLTHPTNHVRRTYLVTVRGETTQEELNTLRKGVTHLGEHLSPEEIVLRKASGKESHLTVQLKEGKNREIRRLFASIRHEVTKLKRVSYGGLTLGTLQPGEYREIEREELVQAFPGLRLRASRDID
jgi:23S rRNA pseudouridine2605 synthase